MTEHYSSILEYAQIANATLNEINMIGHYGQELPKKDEKVARAAWDKAIADLSNDGWNVSRTMGMYYPDFRGKGQNGPAVGVMVGSDNHYVIMLKGDGKPIKFSNKTIEAIMKKGDLVGYVIKEK